jgi:hypothetical protein
MVRGVNRDEYKWLERSLAERDVRTDSGKRWKENFETNTTLRCLSCKEDEEKRRIGRRIIIIIIIIFRYV